MRTLADAAADRPWTQSPPWQVIANRRESHDTVTLELEPPESFGFQPGQFNMLRIPGIGEVPISISGDPSAAGPVLHTIRDVGAVTYALCSVRPGHRIGVRARELGRVHRGSGGHDAVYRAGPAGGGRPRGPGVPVHGA